MRRNLVLGSWIILTAAASQAAGAELLIGRATVDITPAGPVALSGQMHTRIGRTAETPLEANVLALESRDQGKVLDQAIVVSCDVVGIPEEVLAELRGRVKGHLPGFDVQKLFLTATHTHTGPVLEEGKYEIPKQGVIQPAEYVKFLLERLDAGIVRAWEQRQPGAAGWGLGHAVVAQNRRAVYADGHAQMYGRTDTPEFRRIEGYEDHGVQVLFFWDHEKRLVAAAVLVPCTAQEVEGLSVVHADFWHEVRQQLRQRHGKDIAVLGWIAAAGDQSPHLMYRSPAEERMRQLRGLTRLQEIARRIVQAVDEAHQGAEKDIRAGVPLVHKTERLKLPVRKVTEEELAEAKARVAELSKDPKNQRQTLWHQEVIDRYERQKTNALFETEIHVIRLGDAAIATNGFEFFTDFGIQIQARSKAVQTLVVQLAGPGGYLPTERAVRGGGYSAIIESNEVGPEGGQALVDRTVELINGLWAGKP